MSIIVQCGCGRILSARDEFAGRRVECPTCGRTVQIPLAPSAGQKGSESGPHRDATRSQESVEIKHSLDPPSSAAAAAPAVEKDSVIRKMFEALLDPRSIQWMLMIGGGLCVLGLIVWLVSLGVFEDPRVLAVVLGAGSLAILGAGWFVTLRTRFRVAGQALTFLGCVVAPLNLWFYHAQDLITVDGHLWVGGVVCCLLYAVTVVVLRDALFMYAFEAGVTLTTLLLLADMGKITEATWLSMFLMALGLISIHGERAFSPSDQSEYPRRRFGMPLFWSGQVQVAASLLILLAAQLLGWLAGPVEKLLDFAWTKNFVVEQDLLAAALWLAGVYVYLYSDLVIRKVGFYLVLAGISFVMAELTLLLGFDVDAEWIIAAIALTSVAVNVAHRQWADEYRHLERFVPPLGWVLSIVPVVWGLILHMRATSGFVQDVEWTYVTDGRFVAVMLIAAVCNRVNAYLCRRTDPKSSGAYFFLSAASLILAAAGLLRVLGVVQWSEQAPWMMLIAIVYLVASRLWRGHSAERPLYAIAQTATGLIVVYTFLSTLDSLQTIAPMEGVTSSLMMALVFAEAAAFYALAALFQRRSVNTYLAAAAACGALWQFMGYYGVDDRYYTMFYALVGLACLFVGRALGLAQVTIYGHDNQESQATRGRGLAAFQCGNGILGVACLAALMQGLALLATGRDTWLDVVSLLVTIGAAALAALTVPTTGWRRVYATAALALGGIAFLRINLLVDLTGWQKLEIFCVAIGLAMLVASHVGRFREVDGREDESVSTGLAMGSVMSTLPLVIAVLWHRWAGGEPSIYDELALLTVTIPMLVTGLAWQIKSTTVWGGSSLALYLIVLVVSLAYRPQVAVGVYIAVGGAIVFAIGIVLSIYRDKLLEIPERMAKREGVFQILSWR